MVGPIAGAKVTDNAKIASPRLLRLRQFGQYHVNAIGSARRGKTLQAGAFAIIDGRSWTNAHQLTDVHEGRPVAIGVDIFPGQLVHGHVDSIAPPAARNSRCLPPDNATGNFTKVVQRIRFGSRSTAAATLHRTPAGHVGHPHHETRSPKSSVEAKAVSKIPRPNFRTIVPCQPTARQFDSAALARI